MNVLQINTLYKTEKYPLIMGGAEYAAAFVAQEIVATGCNLLVLHCVPRGQTSPEELNIGYKTISLENKNIYWPFEKKPRSFYQRFIWHLIDDFGFIDKKIHEIIEDFKPDAVLIYNLSTLSSRYIDVFFKKKIPTVLILHDYYYICANTMTYKKEECKKQCLACRILTMNRRRRLRKVSSIVAVSDYLGQKVFKFADLWGHQYKVIYNQIDIDIGDPKKPGDNLVFGFLGRISRQKGALDLANAFTRLEGSSKLLFAGDGDDEVINEIRDLRDDRIVFTGFVDKKWFFSNIDVLVVPTLWPEAFGRGVIEGQALGVPAICARSGGLPEAMGGGQYGWLYDATKKDALFTAMAEVLQGKALIAEYSARCVERAKVLVAANNNQKIHYTHLFDVLGNSGNLPYKERL